MAESILKKHQLDITVGVELNDAQRKATSTQIKNMASQWQDILDDAIKKGIEDGARSASLKDVLTQFNTQLKAFKLEPLTITVDELQIMDKPIEHAAKLVIQKLGDSFKGGGLGNIISSEITDSLDVVSGTVDKIYQKMEQSAKKSAKSISKSMAEIVAVADQYTSKKSMKQIDRAISSNPQKSTAETNVKDMFKESYSAKKSGASWDKQYLADVNFVKNYKKVGVDTLKQIFGDQFGQVETYYNNLAKVHQEKIIVLNDILAQNEYVGGSKKNPTQYQFKGEPWAREKTLQEVKQILSGGLTVKEGVSGGDSKNLNTNKSDVSSSKPASADDKVKQPTAAKSSAKIPKSEASKVDTNAFNQVLSDAIKTLGNEIEAAFKQMSDEIIDEDQFDDKRADLINQFLGKFKFDNSQKISDKLFEKSDDMGGWNDKSIYQGISKRLSPEDPSWPKIDNSSIITEQTQAETDVLTKNTEAVKENANAKVKAKDDIDAAVAAIFGETEVVEKNTEAKKQNKQVDDIDNTPIIPKTTITDNVDADSAVVSDVDTTVFSNLNTTLTNLVAALNKETTDVTASVDAAELSTILHDGTPYLTEISCKTNEDRVSGDITSENLTSLLSGIIFNIKNVDAKEPIDSLLHKLIAVDSERERFAYLDSRTGESSRYIEGEYTGITKDSRQDLLKNSAGTWDSTLHTHPEFVAAPSDDDIFSFVKHYAEFKKNFILAGEQLAELDFTDICNEL